MSNETEAKSDAEIALAANLGIHVGYVSSYAGEAGRVFFQVEQEDGSFDVWGAVEDGERYTMRIPELGLRVVLVARGCRAEAMPKAPPSPEVQAALELNRLQLELHQANFAVYWAYAFHNDPELLRSVCARKRAANVAMDAFLFRGRRPC